MTVMTDAPAFELEISNAGTGSPGRARRWLAWVLEVAGVEQETVGAVVLAVSELVTNAVVHTDSRRLLVSARVAEHGVTLTVHDETTAVDWPYPGGLLAEHGRGLVIVEALAAELDITTGPAGTSVTAVIAR